MSLASEYAQSVQESRTLKFTEGLDFRHGITTRYFYDALVRVSPLVLTRWKLNQGLRSIRVDAEVYAAFIPNISKHRGPSEIFIDKRWVGAKAVFGTFLKMTRAVKTFLQSFVTRIFRGYFESRYSLTAIEEIDSQKNLLTLARHATYLKGSSR